MVPPRDLRAPSLVIDTEFVRACVLGEMLEFDLWVKRLGRSSFDLALAGAVKGELRLRAAWTLCTISFSVRRERSRSPRTCAPRCGASCEGG